VLRSHGFLPVLRCLQALVEKVPLPRFFSIARCLQRLLSCVSSTLWLSGLESALTVGTCEPSDDNVNLSLVLRRGQKEERPWADVCWPHLAN
jgi:hypothetical protein